MVLDSFDCLFNFILVVHATGRQLVLIVSYWITSIEMSLQQDLKVVLVLVGSDGRSRLHRVPDQLVCGRRVDPLDSSGGQGLGPLAVGVGQVSLVLSQNLLPL